MHVAAGRAGLVQVDGEHVEVLGALAEEDAAERHVPARPGDDELVVVVDQAAAQQRGKPVAVGVATDLDDRGRGVVHAALAPVGELGEAAAGAVLEVELELAGVERVAVDRAAGEIELAQADLGAAVDDRERMRVLGAARAEIS